MLTSLKNQKVKTFRFGSTGEVVAKKKEEDEQKLKLIMPNRHKARKIKQYYKTFQQISLMDEQ